MRPRLLVPILAAVLSVPAQADLPDGPYFGELPLPPGFSGNVKALGTLVLLEAGSDVHLWSAVTRTWTVVHTSGNPGVHQFNDYAVIQDGNTLHGYSTRGGLDSITLPAQPAVQFGSATSSWVTLATLGSDVWGFAAFHGKWVHQSLASSTPAIAVAQVTAVVHDGTTAFGFSGYHGQFVPVPAGNGVQIQASGDVGLADDATTLRGFSAQANQWSVLAFPNNGALSLQRGYALYANGTSIVAYSGLSADHATFTAASPGFVPWLEENVALLVDGNVVTGYAAATNTFLSRTFSAPMASVERDLALVTDSSGLTAFSGATGAYSTVLPGSYTVTLNDAVVWAESPAASFAYSLVQNTWSQSPIQGVTSAVLRNAVVVVDAQGYAGFSGRTGTWISKASSSPFSFDANPSGDVFVGQEGNQLHLFDPVLVRWTSLETAQPTGLDTWRQTVVASDGINAYGIGLMNNAWDQRPLQGNLVQFDANDACGFVLTDSHVYPYTGHGSFSTLSRWPEFTRVQPKGVDLRLIQSAPPGSSVLTFIGTAAAHIPAGPYGTFFIDPSLLILSGLGTVPAGGLLDLSIAVPDVPLLNGLAVHMQNAIAPPSGKAWLTNAIAPILL